MGGGDDSQTWSDSGDVGGEGVDAVPVEAAACPVVVLSGARVGVAGEDLRIAERTPVASALVIAAWRSECGLMWRGMAATLAILATIR